MKLLELSSNNPKFKTLKFNTGLNIVSGIQLSDEEKKTFNGIGKSLSLRMIHFMFGSSFKTKDEKQFKKYLTNYGEFKLDFTHKNMAYSIKKNFANPEFYINDQKITQKNYPAELSRIFLTPNTSIRFKSVFNCFARKFGGTEYSNVLTQQGRPYEDFNQKFTNLYLLGVDTSLVKEKYEIKELISKSEDALRAMSKYENEIKVNTKDIAVEIERLSNQQRTFVIAENFNELKDKADNLTKELNELRNEAYRYRLLLERKIFNLENSENISIDVEEVVAVFREAKFFFGENVTKRLKEAQDFHDRLVSSRNEKLKLEISEIEDKLKKVESIINEYGKKRDNLIKDLNNQGALEEYSSITERIKSLQKEKDEVEKYQKIIIGLKQEKADLNIKNTTLQKKSLIYLAREKDKFDKIEDTFRSLVKEFYDSPGVSFQIKETNDAKYLFDIDTFIPKEGSQGVGEVKIFCFDVLMFLCNQNLIGFLAHDSCIFSGMDPRQKSMIFKIVLRLIRDYDLQYLVNINQNSLNEILDSQNNLNILSKEDRNIIEKSQILKLDDKSPSSWLFGESFN
jgi:uncharacterized protein YydD (DUF2326 family)